MKNIYVKATRSKEPKLYRNDQEKKINLYQEINEGITSGDIITGGGGDDLGNHIATQKLDLATNKLVGEGGTEGIYVDVTGKVGIGTTTPTSNLSVGMISTAATIEVGWNSGNFVEIGFSGSYPFIQGTDGTASGGKELIINPDGGNVGIGTTTPGAKLEVDGNIIPSVTSIYDLGVSQTKEWRNIYAQNQLSMNNERIVISPISSVATYKDHSSIGNGHEFFHRNSSILKLGDTAGNTFVAVGGIVATTKLAVDGAITQHELSSDPSDPAEGSSVTWQSDGTSSGDDGDIMMKITAGGVTKITTLIDFSTI